MKKNKREIKRNIKHQFYYLPYPTFLIKKVINGKTKYKCFICSKFFPTKSRLSRHFIQTNCLKKNKNFSASIKRKKNNTNNIDISLNKSSIFYIENQFKEKNIEITTLSPKFNNHSLIGNNNIIISNNEKNKNYPDSLIKSEFMDRNENIIGEGHFGKVFSAKYGNNEALIAIKEIKYLSKNTESEIAILKRLKGLKGIPNFIDYAEKNGRKFIIQNLCGPSLDKLYFLCGNKFTDATILEIGIRVIKILKDIHSKGIIHRDIKPSNICYGLFNGKNNELIKTINLVDFGLAKEFDMKNIKNSYFKSINGFAGTMLFSSTAALEGYPPTPKDDVESLFIVLLYLKKGTLPWKKFENQNKQSYLKEILIFHKTLDIEEVFKGFPSEVLFIYKNIKNLSPFDKPDYDIYIELLQHAKDKLNTGKANIKNKNLDWENLITDNYKKMQRLEAKRQDLLKICFINQGYPYKIEKFMDTFSV